MKKKSMHRTSGIVSGAVSLTVATVIVKLLGVLYKVPLARILGEEGMGYFNSAYTVYSFFYLLCTAGVPKAVMILVSKAKVIKASESRIIDIGMRFFAVLGGGVTLLFILLSRPLAAVVGSSKSVATMLAIAPSIVFVSVGGVLRGYFSANFNLLTVAVSQIIEGGAKLVFGLVFAMIGERIGMSVFLNSSFTVLGVTLGSILGLLYLYVHYKILNPHNNIGQKVKISESKSVIKSIFSISIPITAGAAVMSITGIIDLITIMRKMEHLGYAESEATALYGNYTTMAVPMFNLAVALLAPISIAFVSVFAKSKAAGDVSTLQSSVRDSIELSMTLSAPIMVGMLFYSREILSLLFGETGVVTGAHLLTLLAPSIFLMALLLTVNSALESCGKTGVTVIAMLVGSAVKLICGNLLMSNGKIGIDGAPIGTFLCYATALSISLFTLKKQCKTIGSLVEICIIPHACALVAIFISRGIFQGLCTAIGESLAFLVALTFSACAYYAAIRICNAFSLKKLKEMSKYTKVA